MWKRRFPTNSSFDFDSQNGIFNSKIVLILPSTMNVCIGPLIQTKYDTRIPAILMIWSRTVSSKFFEQIRLQYPWDHRDKYAGHQNRSNYWIWNVVSSNLFLQPEYSVYELDKLPSIKWNVEVFELVCETCWCKSSFKLSSLCIMPYRI